MRGYALRTVLRGEKVIRTVVDEPAPETRRGSVPNAGRPAAPQPPAGGAAPAPAPGCHQPFGKTTVNLKAWLLQVEAPTLHHLVWESDPGSGLKTTLNDRALIPFEPALQFPVGDAAVVFELLPLRRVDVMLDHRVAHRGAQHLRAAQIFGGHP